MTPNPRPDPTPAPARDDRLQQAQQNLESMLERIKPYVKRRTSIATSTAGLWVPGDCVSVDRD